MSGSVAFSNQMISENSIIAAHLLGVMFFIFGIFKFVQLSRQKERKIEALIRRSEKITAAAHKFMIDRIVDLRRPLQGLIGVQDLYKNGQTSHDAQDYFEIADFCSKFVIRQLDRVQFFSEIESGTKRFDVDDFSLKECVSHAIMTAREQFKSSDAIIIEDWSPDAPEYVCGNEDALRKTLVELLDNTLKYGGQGSTTLKILPNPANRNQLRFIISDTGPGLSEKMLNFMRSPLPLRKRAMPWNEAKNGLGLLLVKEILHALEGEMTVFSDSSSGTAISFTFSEKHLRPSINVKNRSHYSATNDLNYKVLIVDDDPISRQVILSLLKKFGLTPDTAENGRSAIQKHQQAKYDLIFMDLDMPVLDGFEAARVILREISPGKKVDVVALTSLCTQADIDRCYAIGMSDFIAKPAGLSQIHATLTRIGRIREEKFEENEILSSIEGPNVFALNEPRKKKTEKAKEPGYYINFNKLYNSLDENMTLCHDILRQASDDLRTELIKISICIQNNDRKEIVSILQKLHGEFSLILCNEGLLSVQKMEAAARLQGTEALAISYKEMSELFEKIRSEIERITQAHKTVAKI